MRKRTFVDALMSEVILYGGIPMRRRDVFVLATEHLGPEHSKPPFWADLFAFGPNTAPVDMEPWPLDMARRIRSGEFDDKEIK